MKKGDLMVSINDNPITTENFNEVYDSFLSQEEGEKVTVVVLRKNKYGVEKEKKLRGKVTAISKTGGGKVSWDNNSTEKQLLIRESWLNQK